MLIKISYTKVFVKGPLTGIKIDETLQVSSMTLGDWRYDAEHGTVIKGLGGDSYIITNFKDYVKY